MEGRGEQPPWAVKPNKFIPVLTNLEAVDANAEKILPCTYACGSRQETKCRNTENTCQLSLKKLVLLRIRIKIRVTSAEGVWRGGGE